MFFVLPQSWDGKSKISIVSQKAGGEVEITILDPLGPSITKIEIPAEVQVSAANQLGNWKLGSITKLGEDKNLSGDFLKNTIIKSFKFPVDSWIGDSTNLSFVDKIKIWFFTLSVGNTGKVNVDLTASSYLDKAQLVDGSLGWEIGNSIPSNIESYFSNDFSTVANILINNMSSVNSTGAMVGRVLEVLGLNVASIQNNAPEDSDCKVIGQSLSQISEIAKVFSCKKVNSKPANNFDIEIDLGTKFNKRF